MSKKNSPVPSETGTPRSTSDKESFEKDEIELEIKKLSIEYAKLTTNNLELAKENTRKESYIIEQDKKLALLKERNADDLSQYELEVEVVVDRYEYNIRQATEKVTQLRSQKVKLNELIENSEVLEETIDSILVKMGAESLEHAIEVHDMNKKMQDVRKKMENHLRRDVAQLDLGYQNVAFQCLDDPKKVAMLTNAKLKDEVTLQGVGMANLGVRLKGQARSYKKVKEKIAILHKDAKKLRERLGELKMNKLHLEKDAEELHKEENLLLDQKEKLYCILDESPSTEEIHINIKEIELERIKSLSKMNLWVKRLELLEGMYASIKPVTDFEKNGKYKVENFTMIPHNSTSVSVQNNFSAKSYMPPLSEIEEFMSNDKYLYKALAPLEGKLSRLVTDPQIFSGIRYQNMVAWATHQIISIFNKTEEERQIEYKNAILENELKINKVPKLPIDKLNNNITLKEKRNIEIDDNVSHMEEEWDSIFDFDDSNNDFGSGLPSDFDMGWYKKRTSPKRVPTVDQNELIIVREKGSSDDDKVKAFHFDYSIIPPITFSGYFQPGIKAEEINKIDPAKIISNSLSTSGLQFKTMPLMDNKSSIMSASNVLAKSMPNLDPLKDAKVLNKKIVHVDSDFHIKDIKLEMREVERIKNQKAKDRLRESIAFEKTTRMKGKKVYQKPPPLTMKLSFPL